MSGPARYAALDLGASSARLVAGRLEGGRLEIEELARVSNRPLRLPDGLHWDIGGLYDAMLQGLATLARRTGGRPVSIGVDSWAVDYGLIDSRGRLLGEPYHYRDARTSGRLQELDDLVGLRSLYEATGIQELELNTICQLLAERDSPAYGAASEMLLVPDLLAYFLTGERRCELTNASTTQLMDVRSGHFVDELFEKLELRQELLAPPIEPGEPYGTLLEQVAQEVGLAAGTRVVAVASHDTASAVLAAPARGEDLAYVVSGTWCLVGLELPAPVITDASWRANFSNELGHGRRTRFLKNVMGFWMLQECERAWAREGRRLSLPALFEKAAEFPDFSTVIDTGDPELARPGPMAGRIRAQCERTGERPPSSEAELVRAVLDSMALAAAAALEEACALAGRSVDRVHLVGGGAANRLFREALAAATGRTVLAGPVESSAIGNLMVQLEAAGELAGTPEGRAVVEASFPPEVVAPEPGRRERAERAARRLAGIVAEDHG